MKKILGIVVLGLLLSSHVYAFNYLNVVFKKGISKEEMCKLTRDKKALKGTNLPGAAYCHKAFQSSYIYLSEYKTEIIPPMKVYNTNIPHPKVYFIFEDVNKPMICKFNTLCDYGDGKLKAIAYSKDEARAIADPKYAIIYNEKLKKEEEEYKKIAEENKKKKEKPKSLPDKNEIVPAGSGSGFFVSKDGHAITNYHVIEGCDINKLSFKGSQVEAKVLAVDKVNDIAILKSNASPDVIFSVSNEDVSLLEEVIVAGFPLGKELSSSIKTHKGVVTALSGLDDNFSEFQTDATINQGNSGGPVVNQKGNVVGVAVKLLPASAGQNIFFAIKSSTLKTFASANDLSFQPPNYRDLSNKDLGKLITKGTVYIECHMTVAKIKKIIAQEKNRKAFFKEHVN